MNDINTLISQNFIEQMPGAVAVLDSNSNFLMGNQKMLRWTGFDSTAQLIGKTYADMPCKASEKHADFIDLDKRVLQKPITVLGYYCYKDDNWRVVLAEKYPVKNNSGDTCYHVANIRDITNLPGIHNYSQFLNIKKIENKLSLFNKDQKGYILEESFNTPLSTREFECLFFILRGKTAKETAHLMGLSSRTVEFHTISIKEKFKCHTRSELIEYAIAHGYMNSIPKSLMGS